MVLVAAAADEEEEVRGDFRDRGFIQSQAVRWMLSATATSFSPLAPQEAEEEGGGGQGGGGGRRRRRGDEGRRSFFQFFLYESDVYSIILLRRRRRRGCPLALHLQERQSSGHVRSGGICMSERASALSHLVCGMCYVNLMINGLGT
jgi:hypothetical protein